MEYRIVDAQGVRVPDATAEVTFTVDGPAQILGVENGDLNSPETGKAGVRNAYHGRGSLVRMKMMFGRRPASGFASAPRHDRKANTIGVHWQAILAQGLRHLRSSFLARLIV